MDESHYLSRTAIVSVRDGKEDSNFHICDTMIPGIKCLATGLVLSWLLTDLRCSPYRTLTDLPISPMYSKPHLLHEMH